MASDDFVLPALAFVAVGLLVARRRTPAAEPVGVVSLGPVEHVGGYGNTNGGGVLLPRPGEIPNVDITLPDNTAKLCACAPLRSFGPICEGHTWDNTPSGKVERRTRVSTDC